MYAKWLLIISLLLGGCAQTYAPTSLDESFPVALSEPVWVDADFGCIESARLFPSDVDDCAALLLLQRSGVDIAGISITGGNVPLHTAYQAAADLSGDTPLYRGKAASCNSEAVTGFKTASEKRPLTVFALAPLSTIASFVHCGLASRIKHIIFVGGRRPNEQFILAPGYTDIDLPDMNVQMDIQAVRAVLASDIPMTLVPFEAGRSSPIALSQLNAWGIDLPAMVVPSFTAWDQFSRFVLGSSGMPLWDVHAVGSELWPELFDCRSMRAEIFLGELAVTKKEGRGRIITYCLPHDARTLTIHELSGLSH